MHRLVQTLFLLVTCVLAVGCYKARAANDMKMIEGVVVSAEAGTLVVKDEKNMDHSLAVDSSAQVMIEGKMGKLEDVEKGMKAHVALDSGKVFSVSATNPESSILEIDHEKNR